MYLILQNEGNYVIAHDFSYEYAHKCSRNEYSFKV